MYIGDVATVVIDFIMFKHRRSKFCDRCKKGRGPEHKSIVNNEIQCDG